MPLAALAFLIAAATPAPATADPLRTIVHETVKPACSTLVHVVAPAIEGLRVNDSEFAHSDALFMDAAHDSRSLRFDLDMMNLGNEESVIAQNIIRIDTLLADPRMNRQKSQDDRALMETKRQLEAVLANQKQELNIISGTVETVSLNELLDMPNPLGGSVEPDSHTGGAPPRAMGNGDESLASVAGSAPDFGAATPQLFPGGDSTELAGAARKLTVFDMKTPYFGMARWIAFGQLQERAPEHQAAWVIMALANSCR